jgi:hypothetical protein
MSLVGLMVRVYDIGSWVRKTIGFRAMDPNEDIKYLSEPQLEKLHFTFASPPCILYSFRRMTTAIPHEATFLGKEKRHHGTLPCKVGP